MVSDQLPVHVDSIYGSSLLDESGQPNLIIESSQSHNLVWTLLNNQDQELVVTPFGSSKVDQDQFHFKFDFTPGSLTDLPTVPGWNVSAKNDGKGGIQFLYLALAGTKPLTLQPSKFLQTTLTYTRAIKEDANTTKVAVHITTGANVTVGGTKIPDKIIFLKDLSLVHENTPTLSAPPLAVDFVGRRTVLNDGETSNSFTFALTNMMQADLELKPGSTTFTVWFDVAPNEAKAGYAWALARVQDLSSLDFVLTKPSDDWHTNKSVTVSEIATPMAVSPRWEITVLKSVVLKPQEPVFFTFKGLKTNLEPGIARMYLRFENVSSYRPGVLIGELEKTPLLYGTTHGNGLYLSAGIPQGKTPPAPNYDSGLFVQQFGSGAAAIFNGGKVGIGTGANVPVAKLHIQDPNQNPDGGSLIIGSGIPTDPSLRFGCQPGYAWIQSHAGKPLALNPLPRNVGIGTALPGSSLSVSGGVAIGKGYAEKTTVGDNNLAVEGRIGVNVTTPGSSLSVDGGVAIGKGYAQQTTTVGSDNLAVEGKVGIGTTTPSAKLEVTDPKVKGKIFEDTTTVGILQPPADNVGLSLRKFDANAVMQFSVYDKDGKKSWSNYIQAAQGSADLLIGNTGKIRAAGAGWLELGYGVGKQVDAGKIGYKLFSDDLDIVGVGDAPKRQVRIWDQLQTGNLALTGGATINGDNKQVLQFGYGVKSREGDAGKIGYKVFSEGLDIVGATSNLQNRQIHLWDEVYCHGNFWRVSNGFWCYLDPKNPVGQGSWDYAVFRYSSDVRLKQGVTRIESALEKVRKLKGCSYNWSEEALTHFTRHIDTLEPADPKLTAEEVESLRQTERDRLRKSLDQPQVGILAQDVEAVLPEAVTTEEDGYKTVNYNHLIALLVEAVKEQDQEIQQLKTRLAKAQL